MNARASEKVKKDMPVLVRQENLALRKSKLQGDL